MSDLVQRLRDIVSFDCACPNDEAADRIEELERALAEARAEIQQMEDLRSGSKDAPDRASEDRGTQWIDVHERLPEPHREVLFVNIFGSKPLVCYGYKEDDDVDGRQWFDMTSTDVDGDAVDVYDVTHWMSLPEPPTLSVRQDAEITPRSEST